VKQGRGSRESVKSTRLYASYRKRVAQQTSGKIPSEQLAPSPTPNKPRKESSLRWRGREEELICLSRPFSEKLPILGIVLYLVEAVAKKSTEFQGME